MTATDRATAPVRLRPTADLEAEIPALWALQDAARVADGEIERNSLEYHREMPVILWVLNVHRGLLEERQQRETR